MIEVQALSKRYGEVTAVDDLSFTVDEGQVLGFLGPNGAGKSTTMKMIAGFVAPTSGNVKVCGHDVVDDPIAAKSLIGYLPEGAPSYAEMTPHQFLRFIARMRGMSEQQYQERIGQVHDQLHLSSVWDRSIETLSKGYKRRVGLAQAILHDPKVLILDEPTDGLDPNQKQEVRELIRQMAEDKIIIISTHILEEVGAVCNRAMIIARGKLLADATPAELIAQSRYHNVVRLRTNSDAAAVRARLQALPEVKSTEIDEQGAILAFPSSDRAPYEAIASLVHEKQWTVTELAVEQGRLEEVFQTVTQQQQGVRT